MGMRHSQPTLGKLLAKVMECSSKTKASGLNTSLEKLSSFVFTFSGDMNRHGGEVAAWPAVQLVEQRERDVAGNSIVHRKILGTMYIEKYLESSKGWGPHLDSCGGHDFYVHRMGWDGMGWDGMGGGGSGGGCGGGALSVVHVA